MTALLGARISTLWALVMPLFVTMFVAMRLQRHSDLPLRARFAWIPLLALWLTAPAMAYAGWHYTAARAQPAASDQRAELAVEVEREWRVRYGGHLRWVSASEPYAAAVAFYGPFRAHHWSWFEPGTRSPWVDSSRMKIEGGVTVCAMPDTPC